MKDLLRQYERWECLGDGYPEAWHHSTAYGPYPAGHSLANPAIKDLIREQAGHRCLRCGHPYMKGMYGDGKWTPCDEHCTHPGPFALIEPDIELQTRSIEGGPLVPAAVQTEPNLTIDFMRAKGEELGGWFVLAQWRILTVHHLNGLKHDCRPFNLVALCQKCHLSIQGRVTLEQFYPFEHTDWFKPYAAAWYAASYLGETISLDEARERMEELLALERLA